MVAQMGCTALMKRASLVGAFYVCLLVTWSAPAACLAPGKLAQVRVSKVVDGDTLRLQDGRRVRLIGINTPELSHYGRPVEPFAVQAQRRLQALVAANDGYVGLQVGSQAKDHYGIACFRKLLHLKEIIFTNNPNSIANDELYRNPQINRELSDGKQ